MEHLLEGLLSGYEQGKFSRRELLAALSALLVTGQPTAASAPLPQLPLRCRELNHITLRVNSLARSKQFYARLLGLPVIKEDEETCYLGLGRGFLALWQRPDTRFDHWCVGVQPFTRARATSGDRSREPIRDRLKREGFSLQEEDADDPSIYVRDPDGFVVQLEAPGNKV